QYKTFTHTPPDRQNIDDSGSRLTRHNTHQAHHPTQNKTKPTKHNNHKHIAYHSNINASREPSLLKTTHSPHKKDNVKQGA
ncbi:hypothetical protein RA274_28575, partial [Pseudomonas syringae pv. tagetis]|uniref:hypothetical protein n=1 Tax=Pseudomonas syringae group genomosp. 7 TaxID=251699 RepID=UPI00376F63B4